MSWSLEAAVCVPLAFFLVFSLLFALPRQLPELREKLAEQIKEQDLRLHAPALYREQAGVLCVSSQCAQELMSLIHDCTGKLSLNWKDLRPNFDLLPSERQDMSLVQPEPGLALLEP